MKNNIFSLCIAIFLGFGISTINGDQKHTKTQPNNMNSYLSIFEIPATDFSRAVNFYEKLMEFSIETIDMEGTTMGLFPAENQAVFGAVVKGEGYEPTANGVVIYFNAGENLQHMLDRAVANGAEILVPKTLIDKENGYFAMFLDTEGNQIGLHSIN